MLLVVISFWLTTVLAATGGGSCNVGKKWPICSEFGGKCVNGTCECFPDYTCEYCQTTFSKLAQTGGVCVDISKVGGGDCITIDNGCNNHGSCYVDNNQSRFCSCFDEFVCGNCDISIDDYFKQNKTCPPPFERTVPFGGGNCSSGSDCGNFNGECVNGSCRCFVDRICDHCQVDVNNVKLISCPSFNLFGGAPCEVYGQCFDPFGKCENGHCVCGRDHICPNCQASFRDYANASQSPFTQSSPRQTFQYFLAYCLGGNCSSFPLKNYTFGGGDCNSEVDCGNSSGLCTNGKCDCFTNFVCAHCELKVIDIDRDGKICPVEITSSSSKNGQGNFVTHILILVTLVMLIGYPIN